MNRPIPAVVLLLLVAVNAYAVVAQRGPPVDSSWLSNPPGWITWLSLAGGMGAFIWRLIEWRTARRDRSHDLRVEADSFWYNAIVLDQILRPLITFLQTHNAALTAAAINAKIGKDPLTPCLTAFQKESDELFSRISLLQVLSDTSHKKLLATLEKLDDSLTSTCYHATQELKNGKPAARYARKLTELFLLAQTESVRELRDLHKRLCA